MAEDRSFLGRGWGFPPTFGRAQRGVAMVEGAEDINQSLDILLSTSLKERVMRPTYGCNLRDFQFEAINPSFVGLIKDLVSNAILYHEPRIRVESIEVSQADALTGVLRISVDYRVRQVNSRFNFVYDYYLNEGASQP